MCMDMSTETLIDPDPRSWLALEDEEFLQKVEDYLVNTEDNKAVVFSGRAYINRLFEIAQRGQLASRVQSA